VGEVDEMHRDWDSSWQKQNVHYIKRQQKALPVRRLREKVSAALPKKGFLSLEFGAGGSAWLTLLADRGGRVVGIDNSSSGLRLSLQLCMTTKTSCSLICGDVIKPPFKPGTFDVVFSAGLIEHFKDPVPLLKKAAGLLRQGGICITSVPNKRGFPGLLDRLINSESFKGHIPFLPSELIRCHSDAGFFVESANYVGSFSFGARSPAKGIFRTPYRII
jgi:2-polyprenyl-6-hydroxyphenyl methylase/3-demethylubiquinone-9 3-methyltransferase